MPHDNTLETRLKRRGRELGLCLVGIAPAVTPPGYPRYLEWLNQGRAAGMPYLERRAVERSHPEHVMAGVRSVIVGALRYQGGVDPPLTDPNRGRIARYARGNDYHAVMWERLESLGDWLIEECPGTHTRAVADSAPLLERDFARLAGLGWFGKNTMLINREVGSYFVLGALLVDRELQPDPPHESSHCGTCTRCLDACPTQAFPRPGELDPALCLSYWTIEHRGDVPEAMARHFDEWAFGCDICQEVCPWNRKPDPQGDPALAPRPDGTAPDLESWLTLSDEAMRRAIRHRPLRRAKIEGLRRNAALVLRRRRAGALDSRDEGTR